MSVSITPPRNHKNRGTPRQAGIEPQFQDPPKPWRVFRHDVGQGLIAATSQLGNLRLIVGYRHHALD